MNRISVRRLARFIANHPVLCFLTACLLTAGALWCVNDRLAIEMDVAALLPEESEVARRVETLLPQAGSFDFMYAVLESPVEGREDLLQKASAELAEALYDRRFVRKVTFNLTPERLPLDTTENEARAIALLTEEDWGELKERLGTDHVDAQVARLSAHANALLPLPPHTKAQLYQDPLGIERVLDERLTIRSGPLKGNLKEGYFISPDGRMLLLLLWPSAPATDLNFAQRFQDFLENTEDGLFERHKDDWFDPNGDRLFDIHFFGPHYEVISDTRVVRNDLLTTSLASLFLVLILFAVAFQRPEALVFVGVPLFAGVLWTLGFTSIFPGRLTQVTVAFGAILVGLGIDFSVHVYNRYLEEVQALRNSREALRNAVSFTGPGIFYGALTTAIAFLFMRITRFVGFQELGLVVGIGVLLCLLAVMLVLPPMLTLFGHGAVGSYARRPMATFGLRRFHYLATAYPRVTVITALVVTVYLGFYARLISFEDDFRLIRQPNPAYDDLRDRLREQFELPSNQILVVVEGPTREAALEANDQVFENIVEAQKTFPIVAKDSLRYFYPSIRSQRESLLSAAALDVENTSATLMLQAREQMLDPQRLLPFLAQLASFRNAARAALASSEAPISRGRLNLAENRILTETAQRYLFHIEDGRWRIFTYVYPTEGMWLNEVPADFLKLMAKGLPEPPEVIGGAIIQQELRGLIVRDLSLTVIFILIATLGVLTWAFGRVSRALLAMLPVLGGMLCMMGTAHLLQMKLHYLNILALPMIVGIGVDSGIHILHRFYEDNRRDLRATVQQTGRAIIITALTTMFGFGSLGLANYQGIRDLGILSVLGVTFTLLGSLVVLPAVLSLLDPRVTYEGGPGDVLG